jgi:hypothetical protein
MPNKLYKFYYRFADLSSAFFDTLITFQDEIYLNGFEDKEIKLLQTQMSALDKLFVDTLNTARIAVNKVERRKRRLCIKTKKKER